MNHRDFTIYYDPPPIPIRSMDWVAVHKDYDGPGDNRHLRAGTEEDARREVDVWYEENEGETS